MFDSQELTQYKAEIAAYNTYTIESTEIADKFHIQHKNLIELTRKYIEAFNEFGKLPFQTRVGNSNNPTIYCEYNYDQFCLLVTLVRTTEHTLPAKVELIKRYKFARQTVVRMLNNMSHMEANEAYMRGIADNEHNHRMFDS